MNLYVNHFQCSRNNETGETVIHFIQVSPNLQIKEDGITQEGIHAEVVSSVVMSEENAKALVSVLNDILK